MVWGILQWNAARVGAQQAVQAQAVLEGRPVEDGSILATGPAMLEVDPDADSLLSRANDSIEIGQYRDALLILDHIIAHYGHVPHQTQSGVYRSMRHIVERRIAQLPPEGLNLYRLNVEGHARALIGGDVKDCRDTEALNALVDRYYLSTIGDDAAYALAILSMDRGEFVTARKLLRRILEDYPDPSVDRRAVLNRLAVAAARTGAIDLADRSVAELRRQPGVRAASVRRVEQIVNRYRGAAPGRAASDWAMKWGDPSRTAVMPPLGGDPMRHKIDRLALAWEHAFPLTNEKNVWGRMRMRLDNYAKQSWPSLWKRWRDQRWLPAQQMLVRSGRLYYKAPEALLCRDAATGALIWKSPNLAFNATQWRHNHDASGDPDWPATVEEMLMFGDQVSGDVTLIDNIVFHIEHHDQAVWLSDQDAQRSARSNRQMPQGNRLVAVDAETGTRLWNRGLTADRSNTLGSVRFLNAPVPGPMGMFVVVDRGGDVYLVSLEPETGRMLWDRYLCSTPRHRMPPTATAAVTVRDDEVYVVPGSGVVFCADALDGELKWARQYPQTIPDENRHRFHNRTAIGREHGTQGWEDNAVFVTGPVAVVAPWDARTLLLLDRRTGQTVKDPRSGAAIDPILIEQPRYCIGLHRDRLVTAQGDELVAMDTRDGSVVWRAPIDGATGRAALTEDAIYAPCDDRIMVVELEAEGRLRAILPAITRSEGPIGSLVCDGDRLLGIGLSRVYGLMESDRYLAALDQRIERNNDPADFLLRAEHRLLLEDHDLAIEDLRVAGRSEDISVNRRANTLLFDTMLSLAEHETSEPLLWYDRARELLDSIEHTKGEDLRLRSARADRLASIGRASDALAIYMDIVKDDGADYDGFVSIETGASRSRWVSPVEQVAADAAAGLIERGTAEQVDEYNRRASQALAEAQSQQMKAARYEALARLAARYPLTEAAGEAIAALGDYRLGMSLEWHEAQLNRLTHRLHTPTAMAAHRTLADYYERAGRHHDAIEQWGTFGRRFADQPLLTGDATQTATELATRHVDRITAELADRSDTTEGLSPPPWKKLWELRGWGNFVIDVPGRKASSFNRDYALVIIRNKSTLNAVRNGQNLNEPTWSVELPRNVTSNIHQSSEGVFFNGLIDGNVLVTRDPKEGKLQAIGLGSGNVLWEKEIEGVGFGNYYYEFDLQNRQNRFVSNTALGGGVLTQWRVDDDRFDEIVALDLITGKKMWSRSIRDRVVSAIWSHDGYVMVFTDGFARLMVCDGQTGRVVREIAFDDALVGGPILWESGRMIYGTQNRLAAIDLAMGQPVWELEQSVRAIRPLGHNVLVTRTSRQGLRVIDTVTGRVLHTFDRGSFDLNFQFYEEALAADGRELYLLGMKNGNYDRFVLVIVDLATGEVRQTIEFQDRFATALTARYLADAGEFIPWIVREVKDGNSTGRWQVVFYRKSTGERYTEHELPTRRGNNAFDATHRTPCIAGGMLLLAGHNGITAFGTDRDPQKNVTNETGIGGVHTVQNGETLFGIAERYYGDGDHWKHIYNSNRDVLASPHQLRVGHRLKIPPLPDTVRGGVIQEAE